MMGIVFVILGFVCCICCRCKWFFVWLCVMFLFCLYWYVVGDCVYQFVVDCFVMVCDVVDWQCVVLQFDLCVDVGLWVWCQVDGDYVY